MSPVDFGREGMEALSFERGKRAVKAATSRYRQPDMSENTPEISPFRSLTRTRKPTAARPFRKTVADIPQLSATLKPLLDGLHTVSFDIFDTLLERDIDPPDAVKTIVARQISQLLLEQHGVERSTQALLQLRDQVERELRRGALRQGQDHECSYSDLVAEMVKRILGRDDPDLRNAIIFHELRVEKEVLYVKEGIPELLQEIRTQGKRIIAVSDMYLDKEHIEEILEDKGIRHHFDQVYVSSRHGIAKHSGRLFEYVLNRERLLPHHVLHIGDNRHADQLAPGALRINSLYLKDKTNLRRRNILKVYHWLSLRNTYWRGRHLLQLIRPPANEGGFYYDYGFSVLGPVYTAFILGVIETVKQQGIEHAYFLAREGELFLRIFQLFQPFFFENLPSPHSTYLYVSRRATALPSIWRGLPYETAVAPLYNPKQRGLSSIFKVFGLPQDAFVEIARKHGFDDPEQPILNWRHNPRFRALIEDDEFQHIVVQYAQDKKKLLEQYLEQEGFFAAGSVAFVDIGWNGTIQKFIQDALEDRKALPRVHGLYVGFVKGIPYTFDSDRNTLTGLLYDVRRGSPAEDAFCHFEEIFEEGARALHPTTVGYHRHSETGEIVPVFREEHASDRAMELEHNKKTEAFHRGVLDFAGEFIRAVDLTGYAFNDIKPFINTLVERAVCFPTQEETRQLMELNHAEDFGFDNVMELQTDLAHGIRELLRPRSLLKKIRSSNWRAGTMRSTGVPAGTALLRFFDILRRY